MEIVVRAVVIFLFLWVVTRAVGRSTLGELSTFELLLYVTMGDLVQQGSPSRTTRSPRLCLLSPRSRCSPWPSRGSSGASRASGHG
jgi:uncharacterized membrane protein YcaP (DUF421 family)